MSPRTKEQNEMIRKQRKLEILQAAVRVYVEKGYAASDMGNIAEQAGLAHGLVYYYFKNKKTLFRELYELKMEESQQFTNNYFKQDAPAVELFKNYARIVCERIIEDPVNQRFYMRISLDLHHLYAPEEFSPFAWVKSFMNPMTQAIEKGMKQGSIQQGDANLMAVQFWGSVSQGMNYLDQMQQELAAQGVSDVALKQRLKTASDQIVESSVSLFNQS